MHDELFEKLDIVARYRAGPDVEARERFLWQAYAEGLSRSMLKRYPGVALRGGGGSEPWGKHQLHTAEELALPTRPAAQWAASIGVYCQTVPKVWRALAARHRRSAARQ